MDLLWILKKYRWTYLLLVSFVSLVGFQLFLIDWKYSILLLATLLPGIFYIKFVRDEEPGEKEPKGIIALYILLGIILIFPAIVMEGYGIEILLSLNFTPNFVYDFNSIAFWSLFAVFVVAPVEEILKWIGVLIGNFLHKENDEKTDTIVYGIAVAGGFALFENYRYIFSILSQFTYEDAFTLAIARSFTAVPLHLGVGLLMGYYMSNYYHPTSFSISSDEKNSYLFKALIYPIIIHGIYDLIVFLIFFNFVLQVALATIYVFFLNYNIWKKLANINNKR